MSLRIVNFLAFMTSIAVGLAFLTGALSAANAFFFGLAIITVYVGYQLSLRDGMPLKETLTGLVTRPSTHPRRASYFAYVGTLSISGLVLVQSLAGMI
ncbi:MAG: hypothetical protein EP347_09935 [Alphaproteobacteria bacterium]|nr:MAG: hypothetical protein EP347_09935 [Alphaproteobacteria bacterium]